MRSPLPAAISFNPTGSHGNLVQLRECPARMPPAPAVVAGPHGSNTAACWQRNPRMSPKPPPLLIHITPPHTTAPGAAGARRGSGRMRPASRRGAPRAAPAARPPPRRLHPPARRPGMPRRRRRRHGPPPRPPAGSRAAGCPPQRLRSQIVGFGMVICVEAGFGASMPSLHMPAPSDAPAVLRNTARPRARLQAGRAKPFAMQMLRRRTRERGAGVQAHGQRRQHSAQVCVGRRGGPPAQAQGQPPGRPPHRALHQVQRSAPALLLRGAPATMLRPQHGDHAMLCCHCCPATITPLLQAALCWSNCSSVLLSCAMLRRSRQPPNPVQGGTAWKRARDSGEGAASRTRGHARAARPVAAAMADSSGGGTPGPAERSGARAPAGTASVYRLYCASSVIRPHCSERGTAHCQAFQGLRSSALALASRTVDNVG